MVPFGPSISNKNETLDFHVLVGVGVMDETILNMVTKIHCHEGCQLFQYLSMPVGANPISKAMWTPIIDFFFLKKRNVFQVGEPLSLFKGKNQID